MFSTTYETVSPCCGVYTRNATSEGGRGTWQERWQVRALGVLRGGGIRVDEARRAHRWRIIQAVSSPALLFLISSDGLQP